MTNSCDNAMSLVREWAPPRKKCPSTQISFPRNVYPVAIRANDTLSAQPGEGRKMKKKKMNLHSATGELTFAFLFNGI